MAGHITIDPNRCKGCGLCLSVCPKACIQMSDHANKNGSLFATVQSQNCTGCGNCGLICPDAAITITRTSIVALPSSPTPSRKKQTKEVV